MSWLGVFACTHRMGISAVTSRDGHQVAVATALNAICLKPSSCAGPILRSRRSLSSRCATSSLKILQPSTLVQASGPNSPEYCLGARILWKNTKTLLRAVLDDNTRCERGFLMIHAADGSAPSPCSGGLVIIPKSEPFGDSTNRRQEERSGEKDYRAIWQITADGTLTAVCQELSGGETRGPKSE